MSILSRPRVAITFSRLGWAPALACGCALATGAALCHLFPTVALASAIGSASLALVVLLVRLVARERRIRARLAAIAPEQATAVDEAASTQDGSELVPEAA